MAVTAAPLTGIDAFLKQDEEKELLRFTTAGSVDDGKSTLIGRLLYDSKGVYEDQLASVKKASVNRNAGPIDFSLLTDGLKAEREQGITIDVAYRYFATPRRKFIIADTPGHEQYTRNMATGASTAHLAIVLVDARKGVLPQSRRHAYIAALLGIPHVLVAVNKMDLVEFREDVFHAIRAEFSQFVAPLGIPNLYFVPISALDGDNVVVPSPRTPWYEGGSLLDYLESVPLGDSRGTDAFRFPVQYVVRPNLDFRGYAGQVASGVVRPGDEVMVLPSGRRTRVKSIVTYDGDLAEAQPPQSVVITLADEVDISRGDMLVHPASLPSVSRRFRANLVWMHGTALEPHRSYLIKQSTQLVRGSVHRIEHRTDINTLERQEVSRLGLNEIAQVLVETHRPLYFDPYTRNRGTGSLIVIDPLTNATVAAGMIREAADDDHRHSHVTDAERQARYRHHGAVLHVPGRAEAAYRAERLLFDLGYFVHVTESTEPLLALQRAGVITLALAADANLPADAIRAEVLPEDDDAAAQSLILRLEQRGIVPAEERFSGGEGI